MNFRAFRVFKPIIAFPRGGTRGPLGETLPLPTTAEAIVDFRFNNESPVNVDATFSVQIYLDGRPFELQEFKFHDLNYGHANSWNARVVVPGGTVQPGMHTVTMVLDPFDEVKESDEGDNVYTRTIEWSDAPVLAAPATTYTDTQLRSMLAPLFSGLIDERQTVDELVAEGHDLRPVIQDVADAAYYLVTGRSLRDERLFLVMAPYSDYVSEHVTQCFGTLASMRLVDFEYLLDESHVCTSPGYWHPTAYTIDLFDYGAIIMHTRSNPARVLLDLIHELGHVHQRLNFPLRVFGSLPFSHQTGIKEAQAQTFEAAALRRIEEFLGASLGGYPDTSENADRLTHGVEYWSTQAEENQEHGIGFVLMWLTALDDPQGLGFREELETNGRLSSQASYEMFTFFAGMDENEVWAFIDDTLANKGDVTERYIEVARSRLVPDLEPDKEAHFDFFRPIMLAP